MTVPGAVCLHSGISRQAESIRREPPADSRYVSLGGLWPHESSRQVGTLGDDVAGLFDYCVVADIVISGISAEAAVHCVIQRVGKIVAHIRQWIGSGGVWQHRYSIHCGHIRHIKTGRTCDLLHAPPPRSLGLGATGRSKPCIRPQRHTCTAF